MNGQRFIRSAAVAGLALGTIVIAPAHAAHPPPPVPADAPRIAGTTRIHADSTGGTYLRTDSVAYLREPGWITIDPGSATAIFVGIAVDSSLCYDPEQPHFCMNSWWFWVPEIPEGFGHEPWFFSPEWPKEVYIVTDAPVTVTLHFEDLPGETTINADQQVRGWLDHLPASCPAGSLPCERFSFGGKTRDVGGIGFTAGIAYGVHDRVRLVEKTPLTPALDSRGIAGAWGCLHPQSGIDPTSSSDPADYPLGCRSSLWDQAAVTANFALFSIVGSYRVAGWVDYGASGSVYAGFRASRAAVVGEAHSGGLGLWVSRGFGPWGES